MNLARYIARRTNSDHGTSQNAMVHIATAAVAISVVVAIISVAVMMGFRRDITSLLTSTVADITVASPYAERQPELHPITDDNALRQIISASGSITHIERYALRGGVLRSENGSCGIVVKGVGNEAELSFYSSRLISGESVNIEEQRRKELLISESVATKLGISNGSRIELLLIEGNTPRRELFKVGGIYRSALGDVGA